MVLDYSKWDALELSDDSDIEVHPNVDKRSFIRAKQAQIHQQREQRKHQIATLKYERIINDGLILRIDRLLTALKSHRASSQNPDELVFQSLLEAAAALEDQPPPPPIGVHEHVKDKPTFSRMMAVLVDQVKKEVDEKKPGDRYEGFIVEIESHRSKVSGLQKELHQKLAELEKEEKKYITSDDIRTGFDVSHVSKNNAPSTSTSKPAAESVELLNPGAASRNPLNRSVSDQSSGAEADVEDTGIVAEDDADIQPTADGKAFAKIAEGDYQASLRFISQHPGILTPRDTDGLLVEAFNAELDGKHKYARQCVHQALLIQYCRQLGKDGVGLFFKRITTKGHQAQELFTSDVQTTYAKIHTRAGELRAEREKNPQSSDAGVEQIQLHAVDPNTQINIVVPPAKSEDPAEVKSRQIFEAFPPGLQRALESGALDEVNKVLAKMSVEEAEEVVEKLGDGGMLSLEEGVIDATTAEGQEMMKEIEKTGRMPSVEYVDEKNLAADPE